MFKKKQYKLVTVWYDLKTRDYEDSEILLGEFSTKEKAWQGLERWITSVNDIILEVHNQYGVKELGYEYSKDYENGIVIKRCANGYICNKSVIKKVY